MKTKYRAYALTEILVIIIMVVVLMTLSTKPLHTLISEIPRSARACQSFNTTSSFLKQLKKDVEQSTRIVKLDNGLLELEHISGPVTYTLDDGNVTRRPGLNSSDAQYSWKLPNIRIESKLWNQDDFPYAVEVTTSNRQTVLGKEQTRFRQTTVFFNKGKRL